MNNSELIKIEVLGSSSSGCGYILTFDDGYKIQFDAGVKNPMPDEIKELYISHETHLDHDKYLKDFNREKTRVVVQDALPREQDNWKSFIVPHKALNNGYIVKHGKETIVYITDCGNQWDIKEKFKDATYLFIEANYDNFRIQQKVIPTAKHGSYAFSNLGHSGNLDALNLIYRAKVPATCKIIFVHRSSWHANEDSDKLFLGLANPWYRVKGGDIIYAKSWKKI